MGQEKCPLLWSVLYKRFHCIHTLYIPVSDSCPGSDGMHNSTSSCGSLHTGRDNCEGNANTLAPLSTTVCKWKHC